MRVAVIINPISGRKGRRPDAGAAREALARRVTRALGIDADVVSTRERGHATELARDFAARAADVVIAWGGDGTINEVAGPLIGTRTALGIVPSGSGDGLARSLGLAAPPEAAIRTACGGAIQPVDVGWLGDRYVLKVCGLGFDAAVAVAFNRGQGRGALRYVTHTLSLIRSYRAVPYQVRLDGTDWPDAARFMVGFANGREYGNHLALSADADPTDGWLDAVIVDDGSTLQRLWRARRLAIGQRRPAAGVHRVRVRTASVSADRLVGHVDGETFEARGTLDVRIQAGGVMVTGVRPGAFRHVAHVGM